MEDKYKRVARYAKSLIKEVETIAHSVGVTEPRQFRRHHVRLMQDNGRSELMSDLYPVCLLSWSAAMRAIFSPGSINRPTIAMATATRTIPTNWIKKRIWLFRLVFRDSMRGAALLQPMGAHFQKSGKRLLVRFLFS